MRRSHWVAFIALAAGRAIASGQTFTTDWNAASGSLPSEVCPGFRLVDDSPTDPGLAGGRLVIATTDSSHNIYYLQSADLLAPATTVIETRMRLVSGTAQVSARAPVMINFTLAPFIGNALCIDRDIVFLLTSNTTRGPSMSVDTDDATHTYRVEVSSSGVITVFQDGAFLFTGSTFFDPNLNSDLPKVFFGEGSMFANGTSEWEFFRHNLNRDRNADGVADLCVPTPATFNAVYEAAGGALPEDSCPPWQPIDTAPEDPAIVAGQLVLKTTSFAQGGQFMNMAYQQTEPDIAIPETLVIEARMRLVTGATDQSYRAPVSIQFTTAPMVGNALFIDRDLIFLMAGNLIVGDSASVDTNDSTHLYRIEVTRATGAIRVFRDGVATLTGTTFTDHDFNTGTVRVLFGEGSQHAYGTSEWSYVAHNASTVTCDSTPPLVTITSPQDGDVLSTTSVNLVATVADQGVTTAVSTPAGIQTSLPAGGGTLSAILALENEGTNVLSINATDSVGNVGGTSVSVIRDTILPAVSVLSPASGAVIGLSPITVAVDVVDATATTLTLGGSTFMLPAGGGHLSGDVALIEGNNSILVTVTDEAGNVATATVPVILDVDAPIVTIDAPASGSTFGPAATSIVVTATIDDLTATTVASTPAGVSYTLPPGGGIVSGVVALVEGSNVITIHATDAAGFTGSASVPVVLDTTVPTISIASPSDGALVRGEFEIEARAMDPRPGSGVDSVDFLIDSTPLATLAVAPYEIDIDTSTLGDGPHTITATARDGLANASSASITVLVDNTVPTVSVVSPFAQEWLSGTVPFEVQASDTGSGLSAIGMHVEGQPPTGDASLSYATPVGADTRIGSEDTTRRGDGPVVFTATALDAVGNEGQASIIANADNTAPQRQILMPGDGQVVRDTIAIIAQSTDAHLDSIELLVNGASLGTSPTSPFSTSYDTRSVIDGMLLIQACVRDLAGNTASGSVTVQVDNMKFNLKPTAIHLFGRSKVARATVSGANLALLVPTDDHQLELRVPGGSPVTTLASYAHKDQIQNPDRNPHLMIEFDRRALVAAIQAGMAANLIEPNSTVTVTLTADHGTRVIGTDRLRVLCGRRCDHVDE